MFIVFSTFKSFKQNDTDDYVTITSAVLDKPFEADQVPHGSILMHIAVHENSSKQFWVTKTWKLPQTITISRTNILVGSCWLNKITNLFDACNISPNYIVFMEQTSSNVIKLHFRNRIMKNCIVLLLCDYVAKNYDEPIIIA